MDLEVWLQPTVLEHAGCVPAHKNRTARLKDMLFVKLVNVAVARECSLVDGNLSIVLGKCLKVFKLEDTICDGEVFDFPNEISACRIIDSDGSHTDYTGIFEADLMAESLEVLHIEGAAKTLSEQHFLLLDFIRDSAISIHVGEEKFTWEVEDIEREGEGEGLQIGREKQRKTTK